MMNKLIFRSSATENNLEAFAVRCFHSVVNSIVLDKSLVNDLNLLITDVD